MPISELVVMIEGLLPPSVNHSYISIGKGRKALSPESITWRTTAIIATRNAARLAGWSVPSGLLQFTLELYRGDKRKYDGDNRIKAALDSIALALDFNDERIARTICDKHPAGRETYTIMRLSAFGGWD
jgi:Holliday junction resolvase RusA-like endonuclease